MIEEVSISYSREEAMVDVSAVKEDTMTYT
jgi:hypothetical protein